MRKGYVTFVNDNSTYKNLTDILVESVLIFSTYEIEIFSINFDYRYKYNDDRIIYRRVDIPIVNFDTICYTKLYSTYNSTFDYGVQLDADMIITSDADKLFDDCLRIKNTPLGSLHPDDVNNCQNIMEYLNVREKTQPYLHGTYLFANSCKPFFEECYKISQELQLKNIRPNNVDETIYNVMLWKYGSKDYVKCYDPYYEVFLDNNTKNKHGYEHMEINNYICHGEKNVLNAKKILERLKEKK